MGGDRRAADGGIVRALPQAGRDGGDPLDPGGDRAGSRWRDPMVMIASDGIMDEGQGPSARGRHLRARAGALCAGAARSQPDGRAPQDDRRCRPTGWA